MVGYNENLIADAPLWDANTTTTLTTVNEATGWTQLAIPAGAYSVIITLGNTAPNSTDVYFSPSTADPGAGVAKTGLELQRGQLLRLGLGKGASIWARAEDSGETTDVHATWFITS